MIGCLLRQPNPWPFSIQKTRQVTQDATYAFLRMNEFMANTCAILNQRLTPGFSKHGRVQLVGVDWRLLDHYFCQFRCKKTQRTVRPMIDRQRVPHTIYYYDFSELPDLGVGEWWIKRHYPNETFNNYSESFYTKLKLGVCSRTNRVWVDYQQTTCTGYQ